ncbi:N-acetylmuramoyl-L-alanine amidase [Streptomyces sp. NPDC020965]|uniref:N-acetylmuramoyl-L-alanine amidase n=1 Tax=Streptomyces sp. NPDC020965 TaxID=3365105 RepID=UPI0037BCA4A4
MSASTAVPTGWPRRCGTHLLGAPLATALLLSLLSGPGAAAVGRSSDDPLQRAFTEAADEYRVPVSVLLGVSYLQSRWDTHGGAPSVTGGYGPMHLTDARTALASAPHPAHPAHGGDDRRGDGVRRQSGPAVTAPPRVAPPARLRTLERAATLSGRSGAALRRDPAANVRGGAALLAEAQRRLGLPPSRRPADWFGAVALFSGADDAATAAVYAQDVFTVIRSGAERVTDSGRRVALAADPGAVPGSTRIAGLGLRTADRRRTECPVTVACEWAPAPYERLGDGTYGNHDKSDRPRSLSVRYIVVHDTEGSWDTALSLVRNPAYVSWQYTLRSSDGHVAQHVPLKDVAWQAGNWFVNAKSVGLEHEGFLAAPDAWYTEAMYRSSARLVRHLARRFGVPLDRQHIIGHDNVPGTTAATIRGMHTDPGPYWDWAHYFELLGRPFTPTAGPRADAVTIRPDYARHRPMHTGCGEPDRRCAPHGSGAVRLRSAPSHEAPLVRDIGLRPGGQDATTGLGDTGARASTGQRYAVAGRRGDWTAIWYLGQRAWFHHPRGAPTAVGARAVLLTPRPGVSGIPVYGRAYPEASAYPEGVPVQPLAPLPYRLLAGQRYVVGDRLRGEYLYATTFDTAGHRVVRGDEWYYEIQFGHRVAFVREADARVLN